MAIPPYGQRDSFVPRNTDDFGDGGAFPEIHVAQYPLLMGKKKFNSSARLPPRRPVGTKQLVEYKPKEEDLEHPDEDEVQKTTDRTRAALEKIVKSTVAASQPKNVQTVNNDSQYIKYTPAGGPGGVRKQRIIRMVEVQNDPLEPPKWKHKKAPRGPPSPPVPIMHSPPRKVTQQESQEWKIPPCISNWKNNKGYTIPLDKRLAADGRGLQQVTINENFAKLSQSLYLAEMSAREEVAKRAAINEKLAKKKQEEREEMLRKLAEETRAKRTGGASGHAGSLSSKQRKEMAERDRIRDERRRDRERDRRLEAAGKKTKLSRDRDRDVSEKIALGLKAAPGGGTSGGVNDLSYDQRLFNQSEGLASGFARDDAYNIYDKPLFKGTSNDQIYRPRKANDEDAYGTQEDYDKLLSTKRFQPDKGFDGARDSGSGGSRDGPVQFERPTEDDPFGLDEFLNKAKKARRS